MQEEKRKESMQMNAAEIAAMKAAKAEAYRMVLVAIEAKADESVIKALKAHADSLPG